MARSSKERERTQTPIGVELPRLLRARSLHTGQKSSLRAFASEIGIDPTFLSKAIRKAGGKRVSAELAAQIAEELGKPSDYFVEYRAAWVAQQLADKPELVDVMYDDLHA